MDSKGSTSKCPTSPNTEAAVIPRIPQEIIDEILNHLATSLTLATTFQSCSRVSKLWVPSCRRHLFHTVIFTSKKMDRWLKAFPVPEESPARYVRVLGAWVAGDDCVPEGFFGCIPWFTNVEKVSFFGYGGPPPFQIPLSWGLPQAVTSLVIKTNAFALAEIQDLLARLPNLDSLLLSGYLAVARAPPGIRTVLGGRFGGRLGLYRGPSHEDITNMLLEIPTGLHFTEVDIICQHKCLLSTVRLAEACGKTLVKLWYTISTYDGSEPPERSFDFSKFPTLQEVELTVDWVCGGLFWIPAALSTLRPATSPRITAIRLRLVSRSTLDRAAEALLRDAGGDLRWFAEELARIEREFEGAVNLTLFWGPGFKAVFDALNILQDYAWNPAANLPL